MSNIKVKGEKMQDISVMALIDIKRYIRLQIKDCKKEKDNLFFGALDNTTPMVEGKIHAYEDILNRLELVDDEVKLKQKIWLV